MERSLFVDQKRTCHRIADFSGRCQIMVTRKARMTYILVGHDR